MYYSNDNEKKRVESIMERLQDETYITVMPGSCGKCSVLPTRNFEREFPKESEDIVTLLALYLYYQEDSCPAYNKFSFITDEFEKKYFYVIRNEKPLVFCTEKEHTQYEM